MFKGVEKEQLKVPAHIDYLGDLRDFVIRVGRKNGFSDKIVNAFKLAVDEAATNIIRHAYRESDDQGLITIRAVVKKNSLTLSLIDQGTYFDPKRVQSPDLNRYVDIGKKGGLGIFIMRKLMDNIEYRKTEEGNELRITKFRQAASEKRKILSAVSTIPFSIKTRYFIRTIGIITLIVGLGYLYFFLKTDDALIEQFVNTARSTNAKIINRIRSIPPKTFFLVTDIPPIEEEYKEQIHKISIVDHAIGLIGYSSNFNEFDQKFKRPESSEKIERGVFRYQLNGTDVYEFESTIFIKDNAGSEVFKGRAHIYFSAANTFAQINSIRINNLKLALFILGLSYVGVFVLIYVLMNPFSKLSDWVKNLGHGEELEDDIDIESSGEIGEIAKAFTDITHRFRESQKNLADQERLQKEMQVAQEIQQTLLPMEFPELEGYEISAYYEAAKEVGGDYYDFVEVDKDTLGIAVADVSGKGVPGSLVMAMIRQTLRTEARGLKDAAEVLARVNSFVIDDIKKGMFVTVFYLIIDSKNRSLNYASAGHNPMILYRPSTNQTYYLNPKGFPIGVQLPEKDFFKNYIESDTIKLAKDDILLVYTDGITEAMNSNRELFGEERLQKVLHDYGNLDAENFVEKLKNSIYSFTEGNPQYDDITLVAIREQSSREEDELRRAKEAHNLIAAGTSIREACETVNLTTYSYYNKYKKVFEEEGIEAFEIVDDESTSVEAKHVSIEEKTKLFDIIANHPEFGAGRIREELNTEKYGFTELSEKKIYDELVRNRLNTRQLREAFVNKAQKNKRRLKPPGTPLMTLDGRIIIQKQLPPSEKPEIKTVPEIISDKSVDPETSDATFETAKESPWISDEPEVEPPEHHVQSPSDKKGSDTEVDSLLFPSIEEYLSKDEANEAQAPAEELEETEPGAEAFLDSDESGETTATIEELLSATDEESLIDFDDDAEVGSEPFEPTPTEDFSFEELFDGGTILENAEELELKDEESENNSQNNFEVSASETQEEPENDQVSDTVAASVGELLSEETGESFGADEEAAVEEIEEEGVEKSKVEEKEVSFSDLIQALDDEIVYVDNPGSKKLTQAKTEKKKEVVFADGRSETALIDKRKKDGKKSPSPKPKKSNQLSEKELKLINGIRFYKNRDYENAISEIKKVIEVYPNYKEAHSILGNAYFRVQKYDEASTAYERVKQLDPKDLTAYENMGVIYANRGEYKEALNEWKRVLELNPSRTDIKDKIKKTLRML